MSLHKTILNGLNLFYNGVIQSVSNTENGILDEMAFQDAGTLQVRVSICMKAYERLGEQVKMLSKLTPMTTQDELDMGNKQKEMNGLRLEMAYYAANEYKNFDFCRSITEGLESPFLLCLDGMEAYHAKDYDRAFGCLGSFFSQVGPDFGHFLANQIYGILLVHREAYADAVPYLRAAVSKRPEDRTTHVWLARTYGFLGMEDAVLLQNDILSLIG